MTYVLLSMAAGIALPGFVHASSTAPAPTPEAADKTQVIEWINASAREKVGNGSFSFQYAPLDDDPELEIIAKENSSVHIGSFYILDRRADQQYELIGEKPWNVPQFQLRRWDVTSYEDDSQWNRSSENEGGTVGGKRLFETINHTGGTGLDVYEAHLWYLENGSIVEAWSGSLLETASVPGGQLFRTVGSYQLADQDGKPLLYYWQSRQELDPDTMQPLPAQPVTKVEALSSKDGKFLAAPAH